MDNNLIYTSNYLRNNIIQDSKKTSTQINQSNNYTEEDDHVNKFIMSKGLSGASTQKQEIKKTSNEENKNKNMRISRINIDSKHRNLESKNILDSQIYYLNPNPITIISKNIQNSEIVIQHKNHPFLVNDNIVLQGIKTTNVTLESGITFIENSSFVRINHKNHNINLNTINPIYIEIKNFIGNSYNNTEFNDIPINTINGLKKIYSTITKLELASNDYYYINTDIISKNNVIYNLSSILIIFKDINGINLNLLNANYPVNINQLYGFQTITKITKDSYTIKLNINNNISIYECGGDSIWVAKILDYIEGYPQNNYYKIPLKKTFYNVSKIKLISTEFPNTEKIIKSIPENKKNNAFYWKLRQDGDEIYSIELDPGNYTIELLKFKLKEKIQSVPRNTLIIKNNNITDYLYDNYNKCNIRIEPTLDLFAIQFFEIIYVSKAIIFKSSVDFTDGFSRLIINHPSHRLDVDITITIQNAIETDGIPVEVINNSFTIEKILDNNTYQIKLPKYIPNVKNVITNGGNTIQIIYPIISQLLFDKPDTIGKLIGFRNVGESNSITKLSYMISNTDLYEFDIIDNANSYTNNSINLSGDTYILMTSPIFKESYNTGLVDNIFAKLLLASDPGYILYNQFVQLGETFPIPIPSFSEWEVLFYDSSDNLYNFGNVEHSYTLEIYEEINKLS